MNGTAYSVLLRDLPSDHIITGWAPIQMGEFNITYTFYITFGYIIINSTKLSPTPCKRLGRVYFVYHIYSAM